MASKRRQRGRRHDGRRSRHLKNEIRGLRMEVRRLRTKIGRREFVGYVGIITTILAWLFPRPQPVEQANVFTLGESRLDGPDVLG